jgi:hypothetical protein
VLGVVQVCWCGVCGCLNCEESGVAESMAGAAAGGGLVITGEPNARGIPSVIFVENVPKFLGEHSTTLEDLLQALHTLHR